MRNIYYLVLGLLIILQACQENEKNDFESNGAVYFQPNAGSWNDPRDSIIYSFAGKEGDVQTLNIQVNLMGDIVGYERQVKVVVDKEKTTAEEGTHYKALEEMYILPANAYQMMIPVTLYGSDIRMEERSFQLVLKLEETEDLQLGLSSQTSVRVIMSKMLTKPAYWEEFELEYDWGTYSRVKHEYIIRVLGMDFPTEEEYDSNFSVWIAYGKYMDNYFMENYPIYDENGLAIEPWL